MPVHPLHENRHIALHCPVMTGTAFLIHGRSFTVGSVGKIAGPWIMTIVSILSHDRSPLFLPFYAVNPLVTAFSIFPEVASMIIS